MEDKEVLEVKEPDVIDNLGDNSDEVPPFKYAITSYGADYTLDMLVKRMTKVDIAIPSFQRSYIWTHKDASLFIESLLLGLPVPGIFLAKEASQKLLVIDGQQRLRTLQYFYDGVFEPKKIEFALIGVHENTKMLHIKRYQKKIAAGWTIQYCMQPLLNKMSHQMTTVVFI